MALGSSLTNQITWGAANTKSVAAATTENSDVITVGATTGMVEIGFQATNNGTPASGDYVTFLWEKYIQRDGSTTQYDTPGTGCQCKVLDTYALSINPVYGSTQIPVVPGASYRLSASNNASSNGITVAASFDEVTA